MSLNKSWPTFSLRAAARAQLLSAVVHRGLAHVGERWSSVTAGNQFVFIKESAASSLRLCNGAGGWRPYFS